MKSISETFAKELINFAPTDETRRMGFGESQLNGTVAAYNMLARNGMAYLADEVGMGKTYVALGVLGLLRHINPRARVMVIAPRENIQRKWVKELGNFVRTNWLVEDNRFRNLQGGPVRDPLVCNRIEELARTTLIGDSRDRFLRMTSFSIAARSAEGRKRCRKQLLPHVPWIDRGLLSTARPDEFRDMYGRVLNAIVPELDLLIVDEAHNFKHGFGPNVSNRNRVLGLALGHPDGAHSACTWYGRRVKRLLLLSATPFEYDYADLLRQLDVFGFAGRSIRMPGDGGALSLSILRDTEADEEMKREVVRRMLIRRVSYLNIAGKKYSKNMYRREWRRGGLQTHDRPLRLEDPKERLVVGLIQKKVTEVLGERRFNNSFQIGMLSSFESFLESVTRLRKKAVPAHGGDATPADGANDEDGDRVFYGEQESSHDERRGIDTNSLETVVRSYREQFHEGLPHPKLDATASALANAFESGEKALVFVRRVATVGELRGKLNIAFDRWIRRKLDSELPGLKNAIAELLARYDRERRGVEDDGSEDGLADVVEQRENGLIHPLEDDEGGTDSFFAWFFRGEGPKGVMSGAAFQKNRLASLSSAYSTVFEEDYVSWLLGRPDHVLGELARVCARDEVWVAARLRETAYGYFKRRTRQREGYPRFYVFEAYQVAGLRLLEESGGMLGEHAETVLHARYAATGDERLEAPKGFPGHDGFLGLTTFFTELRKRPDLREAIWPDDGPDDFAESFLRRERRRELISAMSRLGSSYIDVYILAIRRLGSLDPRGQVSAGRPDVLLATDLVEVLDRQRHVPGFHAFQELSGAAETFDVLLANNFPEAQVRPLSQLAEIFGRALQHQVPVGGMSGSVNKRLVGQFRMPGFPLVLVTTDVLQEGEDLHTFCRKVIHYGITWTPSAMEQRTGRIDRIGSLVQRKLDGCVARPRDEDLIQVHLPHLQDTVEVLQVRRVLERLNRFMRLVHEHTVTDAVAESRIDVAEEVLKALEDVPKIEGLLQSAFPVTRRWLQGDLGAGAVVRPDVKALDLFFGAIWDNFAREFGVVAARTNSRRRRAGTVQLRNARVLRAEARGSEHGVRQQPFDLELHTQQVGGASLVRCVSPVGLVDLENADELDHLYELQRELGIAKVCARHDAKRKLFAVTVEGDRLFHLRTTQPEEVEALVTGTVEAADYIEQKLLDRDASPLIWQGRGEGASDA
jgi:helicase-like protein/type III restriction/modification enzyme restriction subunit